VRAEERKNHRTELGLSVVAPQWVDNRPSEADPLGEVAHRALLPLLVCVPKQMPGPVAALLWSYRLLGITLFPSGS
jgi:hypothetical protein